MAGLFETEITCAVLFDTTKAKRAGLLRTTIAGVVVLSTGSDSF